VQPWLHVPTPALRHAGGGKDGADNPAGAAADETTAVTLGASQNRAPGGLAVYNEDEDNLPPLKYEEGPVGAPLLLLDVDLFPALRTGIPRAPPQRMPLNNQLQTPL
jgi:hypothetical protein